MQERNWSEYRLCKQANLPPSTIANIFHRNTTPSIFTLESICNAFGISLCQFFCEENPISLTEDQLILLNNWNTLSAAKKEFVLELIVNIKKI